jgi:hypothetical protein
MNKYDKKSLVKFIKEANKRLKKDRQILETQEALSEIKSQLWQKENEYGETYLQLSHLDTISGETIELDY